MTVEELKLEIEKLNSILHMPNSDDPEFFAYYQQIDQDEDVRQEVAKSPRMQHLFEQQQRYAALTNKSSMRWSPE